MNNFAISSKGVGDALQRSASALAAANNSLDESIALITAANSTVQDADKVGTTMKSVSMFLRAAKTEAEEAGESTEGMASSVSELRREILALTGGKVDIQISADEFKSTYQIVKELSQVWGELTDVSQANILEMVGGKRNSDVVMSMISNFETAEKVLQKTKSSAGSAMAENEKYLDSIRGSIAEFKATFEEIAVRLVDSGVVTSVVDFGTTLMNLLGILADLVELFGGLENALWITGTAFAALNGAQIASVLKKIGSSAGSLFAPFVNIGKRVIEIFTIFGETTEAVNRRLKAGKSVSNEVATSFGRFKTVLRQTVTTAEMAQIAFGALFALIAIGIGIWQKVKAAEEEARREAEEHARVLKDETTQVEEYEASIRKLREAIDLGNLSEQDAYNKRTQLVEIEKDLIELYGNEAKGINLVTGEIENQISKIRELGAAQSEAYVRENMDAILRSVDLFTNFDPRNVDMLNANLDGSVNIQGISSGSLMDAINDLDLDIIPKDFHDELAREIKNADLGIEIPILGITGDFSSTVNANSIYEYIDAYEKLYSITENIGKKYFGEKYLDYIGEDLGEYSSTIRQLNKVISENQTIFDQYVLNLLNYNAVYSDVWSKIKSAEEEYQSAIDDNNDEAALDAVKKMRDAQEEFLSSGWDNASVNLYVERFFDQWNETSRKYQFRLDFTTDFSTLGDNVGKAAKNAVKQFEDEAGKIDLTDIFDAGVLFDHNSANGIELSDNEEAYAKLKEAADKYGVTVSDVIDLMAELKIITLDIPEDNKVTALIDDFYKKIHLLSTAVREFEQDGHVSVDTYNRLIESNSEYADLFDISTGQIKLQSDALDSLLDKMTNEYGQKLVTNQATEDQISLLGAYSQSLKGVGKASDEAWAAINELASLLESMGNGTEYSTTQMAELVLQYPELAGSIEETANGYKIEEEALRSLIAVKAQNLKMNETELRQEAERRFLSIAKNPDTIASVNSVFESFKERHGRNISSFGEYTTAYMTQFGIKQFPNFIHGLEDYVDAIIDENEALDRWDKLISDLLEGSPKSGSGSSGGGGSSETEKTAFEKAYDNHQHLMAMDQESFADYIDWLEVAVKEAKDAGEFEKNESAYNKYLEEIYEGRKKIFDDYISDMEHSIFLGEQNKVDSNTMIARYEEMQRIVHDRAEYYRSMGLDDTSDEIQSLQKMWWRYAGEIQTILDTVANEADEARRKAFDDQVSQTRKAIEEMIGNGANSSEVARSYASLSEMVSREISSYLSEGYKETDEVVANLISLADDLRAEAISALDGIVESAKAAVDDLKSVYASLQEAADEYAEYGFISLDSLQGVIEHGVEYMALLQDENGQLVINRERIEQIVAARAEELAVESALNYVEQLGLALKENDAKELERLLTATTATTDATWGLVYANLALLDLDGEQYAAAFRNISNLQAMAASAVSNVNSSLTGSLTGTLSGKTELAEKQKQIYEDQKEALDEILDYVMDLVKWEADKQIEALEKQVDDYQKIVDLKKEALAAAKAEADYQDDVTEKVGKIAKLQTDIEKLKLDDSREAQAERIGLEEELAELQKDLANTQRDHMIESQEDALDKMADAYREEKEKEIAAVEDSVGSTEKIYQLAINRIETSWDSLYTDLLTWNYSYGSSLQSDIVNAWNNASAAVQEYGSYVEAVRSLESKLNTTTGGVGLTGGISGGVGQASKPSSVVGVSNVTQATPYINLIKQNELQQWASGGNERYELGQEQKKLVQAYQAATGDTLTRQGELWYRSDGSILYTLTQDEIARSIVERMRVNAAAWHTVDSILKKNELAAQNESLASRLERLLGIDIYKTQGGVWMVNGQELFAKYHTGGIVGTPSPKQDEVMALLKKGEAILDEKREVGLFRLVDFASNITEKFARVMDGSGYEALAKAGAASAMRALSGEPTITQGGIHFGDVYIYGANDDTVAKHREVNRQFTNEILSHLRIRK